MDKKEKIERLKNSIINNANNTPEYSAEIIVKFFNEESNLSSLDKKDILDFYTTALDTMNYEDILRNQVEYAIRLMNSNGKLIYEEVHKLFSLFDNIHCLLLLGHNLKNGELVEYEKLQNEFVLNKEAKVSKLVSEDKYEEWKENWWWYRINN